MATLSNNSKNELIQWLRGLLCGMAMLCLSACKTSEVLTPAGTLELPYAIQSMAWHPNGKWMAVGYFNRDEIEVWDVENQKSLFVSPSKRRPVNQSGQEVVFSLDGKYLVVQDFVDTKNGNPSFPKNYEDPAELIAQKDKDRYILARVWDVERRKEIMQLKGPGSSLYGGSHLGMCWLSSKSPRLALLRNTAIAVYEPVSGNLLHEINLRFPFVDKPEFNRSYEKMSCHPEREEIALSAGPLMKKAPIFGFPEDSGATPIVVVDMERQAVKKVLFSATPLNGVAYTADGSKLVSFGMSPTRVWDVNREFVVVGEMANPPKKRDWIDKQFLPVDVLNPPKDAPRGNASDLTAIPGSNLMIGLAFSLHFWDTAQLRIVATSPAPRETLRIAVHAPENTLALAELNRIHFYRINAGGFPHGTKGE
jgi:hypothetical protein